MKHFETFESFVFEAKVGAKITAKVPAPMKKFILGELQNASGWSHELYDLMNDIINMHREYDLDLTRNDSTGPQPITWDELKLASANGTFAERAIQVLNDVWANMGDWAKEHIYADYNEWFRVSKKDRPMYGETE